MLKTPELVCDTCPKSLFFESKRSYESGRLVLLTGKDAVYNRDGFRRNVAVKGAL